MTKSIPSRKSATLAPSSISLILVFLISPVNASRVKGLAVEVP